MKANTHKTKTTVAEKPGCLTEQAALCQREVSEHSVATPDSPWAFPSPLTHIHPKYARLSSSLAQVSINSHFLLFLKEAGKSPSSPYFSLSPVAGRQLPFCVCLKEQMRAVHMQPSLPWVLQTSWVSIPPRPRWKTNRAPCSQQLQRSGSGKLFRHHEKDGIKRCHLQLHGSLNIHIRKGMST